MTDGDRTAVPPVPALRRRWRLLAGGASMALLLAGAVVLWRNAQQWRERETALRLAEVGKFAAAEPLLRRAWDHYPRDWQVAKALALGYLEKDEPTAAAPCLTRWCDLQPGETAPFRLRFEIRLHLQQRDGALEDGLRVLEREPENVPICRRVIQFLARSDRFAEVDAVYQRCLRENPEHPDLMYLQVEIHQVRGEDDKAREAVEALLRRHPGHPHGTVLKAALCSDAGKSDEAIALLRPLVARHPKLQSARYHLALALMRVGKADDAGREMDELRRHRDAELLANDSMGQPYNRELRLRAAQALLDVGQDEQALELLQAALADAPDLAPAHRLLADYYDRRGQPRVAAGHRRRAGPSK
jgi:predicted Zn-dependent protease